MKYEKYLNVKPVVIEDMPDAHTARFEVGGQSFCIGDSDTEEGAKWLCVMFAKALDVVVKEG